MSTVRQYSQIIDSLRSVGLRPTRQRLALTKLLFEGGPRHVTAESLHREAVDANIKVSLATVYNALHQLNKAGLLREIVVEAGRSHFDTNISDHHHIFDEDTRELTDIKAGQITMAGLPEVSDEQEVSRIDVILRVKHKNN